MIKEEDKVIPTKEAFGSLSIEVRPYSLMMFDHGGPGVQ